LAPGWLTIRRHTHAETADAATAASLSGQELILLALRGIGNRLVAEISVVVNLALAPARGDIGPGCKAANRIVAL
jgi:hypothetical protein